MQGCSSIIPIFRIFHETDYTLFLFEIFGENFLFSQNLILFFYKIKVVP